MSSGPLPQGIYIFVKYNGDKAAQHFTKEFTPQSSSLFRRDLVNMRFPHPKMINTRLAPDATVVAWWPDVSHKTHDVLYNNFKNGANQASGYLVELSISFLIVQKMEAGGKNPILLASAKRYNVELPTLRTWAPLAKRRKVDVDSSFVELSRSRQPDPVSVPQSTTEITSTAQKRTRDGQIISSRLPPKPSALVLQQAEELSFIRRPQSPVPAAATTSASKLQPPPKLPATPLSLTRSTPLNASSTSATQSATAKDAELDALRKRVKSMEEMLRAQLNVKLRLDETANKLEAEKEAREKLKEMVLVAREGEDNAIRRLGEVQRRMKEEGWRRSEADDLVATMRQDIMAYHDACNTAKREKDELAHAHIRVQEELSVLRHSQDSFKNELDQIRPKLEHLERRLKEEKSRRRRYQDRVDSAERREATLAQRYDDARRLSEEKSLAQQTEIQKTESAMQAAQASEAALKRRLQEAEDRLEAAESRLETEKRQRREAEDAIADIRRECREPFVVPSLLDAFVELAKLTTAATTTGSHDTRMGDLGDIPLSTNGTVDAASGDMGTAALVTYKNGVHKRPRYSPCSQPYSPRSPQYRPFSPQYDPAPLTPRLSPCDSPNGRMRSPNTSNQIKLEQFSSC